MNYLLKKQIIAKLVTLLLFAFCGSLLGFAQDRPTYEENSLYVKFKDNSNISAKKLLSSKSSSLIYTSQLGLNSKIVSKYGIQSTSSSMELFDNPILDKTFKIQTNPALKTNIDQLIKELEKDPNIEYVERVPISYLMQVQTKEGEDWTTPNDPFYSKEYGSLKLNLRWHLDLIRAQEAWAIQKGDPKMKIAVVDNAIVGTHEDLLIPREHIYNSNNNTVGDANPPSNYKDQVCILSNLYDGSCNSYDYSHGTHCAGAIGAINNNGIGISSVGGGVSLLGIGGPGPNPDVMNNSEGGVRWAANNGAKVISCSWGSDSRSFTQEQLMKSCYDRGIIVIAAAGNDNVSKMHYPAAYYPYVISVGSVDSDKSKSSFSNHGQWVSINSPGGVDKLHSKYNTSIFSTTFCINQSIRLIAQTSDFDNMRYDEMQGTSMATPVAAGAVSLLVSKDTSLNTDEVRTILQNTSQAVFRNGNQFSELAGIIDIYSALKYLDTVREFGPKIPSMTITSASDSALIEWTAPETEEVLLGYNLYRNGKLIANNIKDTSYLDSNLNPGTIIFSVEPIYKNFSSIKTEAYTTIKTFYNLTIRVLPAESGTTTGTGKYEANSMALVEAIPAEGYLFDHWEDASATNLSSNVKMFIRMSSAKILFAKFKAIVGNDNLELDKKGFSISPNPAQNEVYIRSNKTPMQSIVISDTKGQIVFSKELSSNEEIINVQDWNSGLYTVRVSTQNGTLTSKLIKK